MFGPLRSRRTRPKLETAYHPSYPGIGFQISFIIVMVRYGVLIVKGNIDMSDAAEHFKRQKYYDTVKDGGGNERPVFSHMTIETDEGTYVLGDVCKKCGSKIVPRMTKVNGEYHTKPWCPKCRK